MLKKDVIDHFETASNVARALGITPAAIWKWGVIVPYFSAKELERITERALRVRDELYVRGRPNLAALAADHAA
jgi:transcriptional repressor of cell division inhibition gene dicB